jgi:hypothetical protein
MSMTLQAYDPKKIDEFALRLLDLAATLREMSNRSRDERIDDFALHDKKALEWCAKLEQWARKTRAELELRVLERKAERRARGTAE